MLQTFFEGKFLNFPDWLKRNPDAEELEMECDECDGTGEIECFHCGQETECETCGGSGLMNSAKAAYEQQVEHDKRIVRKYTNWLTRADELRNEAVDVGQGMASHTEDSDESNGDQESGA